MDHGLGHVASLPVVAHEAAPAGLQPKVRSTTHRRGSTSKPLALSDRRTTSTTKSRKAALSMSWVRA